MKKQTQKAVLKLCAKMRERGDVFISKGIPDRIFWKDGSSTKRSVWFAALEIGAIAPNRDGLFEDTPQTFSVVDGFEQRVAAAGERK